jgi:O-antigen ligase
VGQFTEAESTDNDFLRNLGETGALGFITFYAPVVVGIIIALRSVKKTTDPTSKAVFVGYVAAAVGLLLNAIYIDVFEASKVALSFWALTGMMVALSTLTAEPHSLAKLPESPLAVVAADKPAPKKKPAKTKKK